MRIVHPDAPPSKGPDPLPWMMQVAHMDIGGRPVTAIARIWDEGEAERCRLCPTCKATKGHCLVLLPYGVPMEEAALFSLTPPPDRVPALRLAEA